jgi:hypothetical protein
MNGLDEARRMLDLAATDLRAVELMVGEPGFDDAIVGARLVDRLR